MRRREQQSAEFREALWVSRCVGHAATTPLRPSDVEDLASFIQVRTLAAGEPLVRAGDEPTDRCWRHEFLTVTGGGMTQSAPAPGHGFP